MSAAMQPNTADFASFMEGVAPERLRELLTYDPVTGLFTWLVDRQRKRAGAIAGWRNSEGYIAIGVDQRDYLAHRLAWLFVTGEWPVADVDHRNLDRSDNAWTNLRAATRSQNMANGVAHKDNRSGFRGVSFHRGHGLYRARICRAGRSICLGYFKTPEEASRAYQAAAVSLFGEFAGAPNAAE